MRDLSNAMSLIGATAGISICLILPATFALRTDFARRERLSRCVALLMVLFGVAVCGTGLACTFRYWGDAVNDRPGRPADGRWKGG